MKKLVASIILVGSQAINGHVVAEGLFTNDFLCTEDGVPVQRATGPLIGIGPSRGLAYDSQERMLWFVNEFCVGAFDLNTGQQTFDSLALYPGEGGLGMAFNSRSRSLFIIHRPGLLEERDLSFNLIAEHTLPFFIGECAAGLAYDPAEDALWTVVCGVDDNILRRLSLTGSVESEMDLSSILIQPAEQIVGGLAFDVADETIWLQTFAGGADGGYLINVNRDGQLVARHRIPDFPDHPFGLFDIGLAWCPDPLPDSHIAVRSGFLRGPSNEVFYTPPPALFVDDQIGDANREITIALGSSFEVFVDRVSGGAFALFAFPGETGPEELSHFVQFPVTANSEVREAGVAAMPLPLTDGDTSRSFLVINATGYPSLGSGLISSGMAPARIPITRGTNRPRVITLQVMFTSGFVRLGNAVVLRIE